MIPVPSRKQVQKAGKIEGYRDDVKKGYYLVIANTSKQDYQIDLVPFTVKQLRQAELLYTALKDENHSNPNYKISLVAVNKIRKIKGDRLVTDFMAQIPPLDIFKDIDPVSYQREIRS